MSLKIPFTFEFNFEYRKAQTLTPLIRRVIADNPSPFTFKGTGTYIVGHDSVAVIDPGPLVPEHINALKTALRGEKVTHILVTHTHKDHSPAAAPLKSYWGVKTYAYGSHGSDPSQGSGHLEEGSDTEFTPDVTLRHGDLIEGDGWTLEALHTPGHTSNHMCYALHEDNAIFTGDHVMGWSTTVIAPPDGNMTQYMKSLDLMLARNEDTYWPTHGACITNVKHYVQSIIQHRLNREQQILELLEQGYSDIRLMIPDMYTTVDKALYPAAAQSVLSAMIRLVDTGRVVCDRRPSIEAQFKLT
ncbi:MAG: MBL fold metallo-hydrolase [Alphaproteobacteria bacterium TMED87]|nr:MAG: MBL fold metallo-hydrolase [Alphaproteobacteria bacterium TMED87]|tara:strand:- start:1125 stop:2027 length:903 start_codon:yes stop_codon:yes gene_type:complete